MTNGSSLAAVAIFLIILYFFSSIVYVLCLCVLCPQSCLDLSVSVYVCCVFVQFSSSHCTWCCQPCWTAALSEVSRRQRRAGGRRVHGRARAMCVSCPRLFVGLCVFFRPQLISCSNIRSMLRSRARCSPTCFSSPMPLSSIYSSIKVRDG